jgi:hypothetical protein
VRRFLKRVAARTAAGLEYFHLIHQLPVARREQLDLALLSDHHIIEFGQRTLEMSELDLDLIQAGRFGHGGMQAGQQEYTALGLPRRPLLNW